MTKSLLRKLPDNDTLLREFKELYPEVHPFSLLTHIWLRTVATAHDEAIESFLSEYDVSSGRYLLMTLLERTEEGQKPSELALNLGVTQATVTGLLDGLEKCGWVKRKEHHRDGRACVAYLTEPGRKFMQVVRPEFNKWVTGIFDVYSDEEKRQLVFLMNKFFGRLRETPIPVPSPSLFKESDEPDSEPA